MVCPAPVLGGGAHKSAPSPGALPEYIRKAWGVPEEPLCVRLTESDEAVAALFNTVIEARVSTGDAYIAAMNEARSGAEADVWNTTNVVPRPRCAMEYKEEEFFRAQGAFALNATLRSNFCDGTIPPISIGDYNRRFFHSHPVPHMSNTVYLLMLIYLDRAMARCPGFFLNSYNAHRMCLAAFVVAAKYHEDEYVLQAAFASHGGVSVADLGEMEREFLQALDYRCLIQTEAYEQLEIDLMVEALESPHGSDMLGVLRAARVIGVEEALACLHFNGSSYSPPRRVTKPLRKGDSVCGVQLESHEAAHLYNVLVGVRATHEWHSARAELNARMVRAHARALVLNLFPGVPVDLTTGALSWRTPPYVLTRLTPEQKRVLVSLQAMIRGDRPPAPVPVSAPTPLSAATWTRDPLEHSTVIAKSAVSFILNDDPFADLQRAYPRRSNIALAAAQQTRANHALLW